MEQDTLVQAVRGRQNDGNYKGAELTTPHAVRGRQNDGNYKASQIDPDSAEAVRGRQNDGNYKLCRWQNGLMYGCKRPAKW